MPNMVEYANSNHISLVTIESSIGEVKEIKNKYGSPRLDMGSLDKFYFFLFYLREYISNLCVGKNTDFDYPIDPVGFIDDIEDISERLELYSQIEDISINKFFFEDMEELGNYYTIKRMEQGEPNRSSLRRLGRFFSKWYDSLDSKYYFSMKIKDKNAILNITLLDPSEEILPVLRKAQLTLSMSGTMIYDYYINMTGLNQLRHKFTDLPSPYSKNLSVIVFGNIDTIKSKRNGKLWDRYARIIKIIVDNTPFNSAMYAGSYEIQQMLVERTRVDKELFVVEQGLSSLENDLIINKYKSAVSSNGGLLYSVVRGRNSEGVDFMGDLMNSVGIIGFPHPPLTGINNAKVAYLNTKFPGKGYDLVYIARAVIDASQSAGRAVRSVADRSVILLLDDRFAKRRVMKYMPDMLVDNMVELDLGYEDNLERLEMILREFYDM